MNRSIYIGYDVREAETFAICRHTLRRFAPDVPIHAIDLEEVRNAGLYWRPTSRKDGRLFDEISGFPMATEFAISRFLTPVLAKASGATGWALFMDSDVMARDDIDELFAECNPKMAVMCVKHRHLVTEGAAKMDGQVQTNYSKKNWSSVMAFNLSHPSNRKLTVKLINEVPGRELHAFSWLDESEIGALGPEWNYLVGYTELPKGVEPKLVHHTEGGPWLPNYQEVEYANDWRAARAAWLSEGKQVQPAQRLSAMTPRRPNGALVHA
jgi:hypothetical protein